MSWWVGGQHRQDSYVLHGIYIAAISTHSRRCLSLTHTHMHTRRHTRMHTYPHTRTPGAPPIAAPQPPQHSRQRQQPAPWGAFAAADEQPRPSTWTPQPQPGTCGPRRWPWATAGCREMACRKRGSRTWLQRRRRAMELPVEARRRRWRSEPVATPTRSLQTAAPATGSHRQATAVGSAAACWTAAGVPPLPVVCGRWSQRGQLGWPHRRWVWVWGWGLRHSCCDEGQAVAKLWQHRHVRGLRE